MPSVLVLRQPACKLDGFQHIYNVVNAAAADTLKEFLLTISRIHNYQKEKSIRLLYVNLMLQQKPFQ